MTSPPWGHGADDRHLECGLPASRRGRASSGTCRRRAASWPWPRSGWSNRCRVLAVLRADRRGRRRLASHQPKDIQALFARQKRAERPQIQVEVFDGETEVVPQLGHPVFEGHQSRSDLLDLVVGERPLVHPAQGLTLHQLAQQFDEGQDQGHQPLLHRFRVGVDPEAVYRFALIRLDHAISHQLFSRESSMPSTRALTDDTSARSETVTRSTSAMDSVTSPMMTTPPASTRSSRSTSATRSSLIAGWYGAVV